MCQVIGESNNFEIRDDLILKYLDGAGYVEMKSTASLFYKNEQRCNEKGCKGTEIFAPRIRCSCITE